MSKKLTKQERWNARHKSTTLASQRKYNRKVAKFARLYKKEHHNK